MKKIKKGDKFGRLAVIGNPVGGSDPKSQVVLCCRPKGDGSAEVVFIPVCKFEQFHEVRNPQTEAEENPQNLRE